LGRGRREEVLAGWGARACSGVLGWLPSAAPPWLGGCPNQRPEEERLEEHKRKRKARKWEEERGSGFLYL